MEVDSDSESVIIDSPHVSEKDYGAIPEKSKTKYEGTYKIFSEWLTDNNFNTLNENIFLTYFTEMSTKFKPTTLWTNYSMLRTTVKLYHKVDIEKYVKLRQFLRAKSYGYKPKTSSILTSKQIDKFIRTAPDRIYLLTKVRI